MAKIPYWIEEKGNNQYGVWIKISIPANTTKTIFVKKQAGEKPNGDDVFVFFDDFDKDTLDTNKWFLASGNPPIFENSRLKWRSSGNIGSARNFLSHKLAFECKWENAANISYVKFGTYLINDCNKDHDARIYTGNSSWTCTYKDGDCGYHYTYSPTLQSGVLQIWYKPNGRADVMVNNQYGLKDVITRSLAKDEEIGIYLKNDDGNNGEKNIVDWVRVRKLTANTINISYEDLGGVYKVNIENQGDEDLEDFQIELDGSQLGVSSRDEGLLILETLAKLLLVSESGEIYTVENGQLKKVADSIDALTTDIIESEGVLGVLQTSKQLLSQLGNKVGVLVYNQYGKPKVEVRIDPYPQVLATKEAISIRGFKTLNSLTIDVKSQSENYLFKMLVSPNGKDWYKYDNGWVKVGQKAIEEIVKSPQFIDNNGINQTTLNDTQLSQYLQSVGDKMYFAFLIDGDIVVRGANIEGTTEEMYKLSSDNEIYTAVGFIKVKFNKEGEFLVVVV